ncbi:DUF1761 domain-containing protein [Candidatus Woesearchaeota archaeon]|nr:DUF1761 domain-containing protein [Candidatus Woesearchaeota archaeon]
MLPTVNWIAIVVVAIVAMLIGMWWYSLKGFGKQWIKLMGISQRKMKEMSKNAGSSYLLNIIATLVMAYVLALFIAYTSAITFVQGMQTGFWLWLGFIVTVQFGQVLWEKKKFQLFLLNTAYNLVGMLVMGGILAIWP